VFIVEQPPAGNRSILQPVMLIKEMNQQECAELLARAHLASLACCQGNRPYVAPCYLSYSGDYLYGFSTVGQKIEWMRVNPQVCVEADEVVSQEEWASVIVAGHYEELPDTPEYQSARASAHDVLQKRGLWWEPGYVKTILHGAERPLSPVFYRIRITDITGHRATP
jgi:nitroimidazol reductase NimA-like FMN-containing flavoprotein (pyridoxamine 5'-phosphate oxidase superfamily)